MKLNLAQKLILIIESVVVVFAIVGGSATYLLSKEALTKRFDAQLESVAVLKEHNIDRFVAEVLEEMDYLASGDQNKLQMIEFLTNPTDQNLQNVSQDIGRIFDEKSTFESIFVMDRVGEIVYSTSPDDEGKIKVNESYFVNGKVEPSVQDFYYDQQDQETNLFLTAPVLDDQANFLGMIVGKINVDEISKLMFERSGLGESGETYLVNKFNLVITELRQIKGNELKKTIYSPQITKCLAEQSNFSGTLNYIGNSVAAYYRWIPSIKSCLITEIALTEVLEPIESVVTTFGIILLVVTVVVSVLGYYLARLLSQPLMNLRDEALKIKEGIFTVECKVDSDDEIGEVAVAFNAMGKRLKEMYSELEAKVEEKTSELSLKLKEMDSLNRTLKDNEVAMLNILEDEKELEKQLASEKKGVEKKVEERTRELSNERAELLAVINSISRGLIVVDQSTQVILENKTMAKLMGVSGSVYYPELVKYLQEVVDLNKMVSESFIKNKEVKVEAKLIGARYLNIHTVPVLHEDTVGAVAIFVKDVTENMTIQRSRDEFFSIASHELRTPLTAIRGNTSMMLEYYGSVFKDPELRQMLDDTHEASIRLIGIVNDFLDMSRLEMSKVEFKLVPTDLPEIIAEVIKEYEITGSRQKLYIELVKPKELVPQVKVDRDRLKQILINLIGNALKFTKEGGIRLELHTDVKSVAIWVIDTGSGIPAANQGLLFHKFQQAGSSLATRDASKSTGLGLYISRLLAEGMGGKLELIKSDVGQGSIFGITLPLLEKYEHK